MSGVFKNIDPPPAFHPASVFSPRAKGGGIGLLQYNLSTVSMVYWRSHDIQPSLTIRIRRKKQRPIYIKSIFKLSFNVLFSQVNIQRVAWNNLPNRVISYCLVCDEGKFFKEVE